MPDIGAYLSQRLHNYSTSHTCHIVQCNSITAEIHSLKNISVFHQPQLGKTLSDFNNFGRIFPEIYWLEEMVSFPTSPNLCSFTT